MAALSGLVEVMVAVAAFGEIVRSSQGGGGGMWRLCQDLQRWWRQSPEFLCSVIYLKGLSHDMECIFVDIR